jgi:hypothetical protein
VNLEEILLKNRPLKNLHAGRRCFIVGNAPSINGQDLSLLENEVTIVVTSFFRHPAAKIVRPGYWVIADPYFWERPEEFFIPAFNSAHQSSVSTKLFIPSRGIPRFANFCTGPLIDLHFLHFSAESDYRSQIDFTGGIPPYANNVILICIMLAYYMGCNPIYLMGCDHDFLKVTREEYESKVIDHFYREAKQDTPCQRMPWDEWLTAMDDLRGQYENLKRYADRWGFSVFNATRGGCLETFPRVEYESLFPHKGIKGVLPFPGHETADPQRLFQAAVKMIDGEDYHSALVLIEQGLKNNINRPRRVEGLEYLKAFCLVKLGRYHEALILARQDYACNPGNREISSSLIQQLEEAVDDGLLSAGAC